MTEIGPERAKQIGTLMEQHPSSSGLDPSVTTAVAQAHAMVEGALVAVAHDIALHEPSADTS
jgi:hypothetical protein